MFLHGHMVTTTGFLFSSFSASNKVRTVHVLIPSFCNKCLPNLYNSVDHYFLHVTAETTQPKFNIVFGSLQKNITGVKFYVLILLLSAQIQLLLVCNWGSEKYRLLIELAPDIKILSLPLKTSCDGIVHWQHVETENGFY